MKSLIKTLLRENLDGKDIRVKYLHQLLNNLVNKLAIKYVKGWINRGSGETIKLSPKELDMLKLIEKGGPHPSNFSTKN